MQALIVSMGLAKPVSEVLPLLESYDRSLDECEGHVAHYWLHDNKELGLFHLFTDEKAATQYLESRLLATLTAHSACSGQTFIRWFDVVTDGVLEEREAPSTGKSRERQRELVSA